MTAANRSSTLNHTPAPHRYRYFDFIMVSFVTILLCSNLVGAPKVCHFAGLTFTAGVLFFPISYLFGDILTEVYGYARSRRVVWSGFAAMLFASFAAWFVIHLPPAPGWDHQAAIEAVFASTPRIFLASLVAYFAGEFSNSFVLAKMKVKTEGRYLGARFVLSTIAGEAIDSAIFYPIAFFGTWSNDLLIQVVITNYTLKVVWEMLMLPFTYRLVAFLKRVEGEDYFDRETDFNPFHVGS